MPDVTVGDTLAEAVHAPLPGGWSARLIARVDSTQDTAWQAARLGSADRFIVVADFQARGRGRQGRVWVAPPGTALMCSILFRDDAPAAAPQRHTRLVSVALAEAIERIVPELTVTVKWPNDLLVAGRKVAGVLAEAHTEGSRAVVVVGAGVNVSQSAADLATIGPSATSLRAAAGRSVDRGLLFSAFVERLTTWENVDDGRLARTWAARLWGRGQALRLRSVEGTPTDEVREAVVLGVDADGALRVRLVDGSVARTFTAEVIL